MDKTLEQYLEGKTCEGLKLRPQYFQDGDFVTYFFREDVAYEERFDELLTIYKAMETGEMVGCKIKGVCRILSKLKAFKVVVDDERWPLALMFLGAALVNPASQDEYQRHSEDYGEVTIDSKELCPS
jgi:hypothetical protein